MHDVVDLSNLELMDDAEVTETKALVSSLFGEFDPRVEIEGVFFGERRYPHTAYLSKYNRFHVAICIPKHQANNPLARLVNLSHELVHCLSPNGWPPKATVLEEGLAEHSKIYLSRSMFQNDYPDYDFRELSTGKYRVAFDEIENIIFHEGIEDMRNGIRAVRGNNKIAFYQITKDDLEKVFLRTPQGILENLSKPFKEGP